MVPYVGCPELASGRRKSSLFMAAVTASVAVFFAVGASGGARPLVEDAADAVAGPASGGIKVVAAAPPVISSGPSGGPVSMGPDLGQMMPASRLRVVGQDVPRLLAAGVASERGLQVRTIQAARSISAAFPEIHEIGGVRADALQWHPNGLALDVMIPNPGTAEGIALGNEVVRFALKNTDRFGLQDAIWRGTYYTPNGPRGSGYGHYDHVHVTTTGGGYPGGDEVYLR